MFHGSHKQSSIFNPPMEVIDENENAHGQLNGHEDGDGDGDGDGLEQVNDSGKKSLLPRRKTSASASASASKEDEKEKPNPPKAAGGKRKTVKTSTEKVTKTVASKQPKKGITNVYSNGGGKNNAVPTPNGDSSTASTLQSTGAGGKAKFVYNAYNVNNQQPLANVHPNAHSHSQSCTSDDENVILKLNVPRQRSDDEGDRCGGGGDLHDLHGIEVLQHCTHNGDRNDHQGNGHSISHTHGHGHGHRHAVVVNEHSNGHHHGNVLDHHPHAYDELVHNSFMSKPCSFGETENDTTALHLRHQSLPNSMSPSSACVLSSAPVSSAQVPHSSHPPSHQHEAAAAASSSSSGAGKQEERLKKIRLLVEFEEKNKANEWPNSTSIHCYWCCHKFETPPCGIPLKYVNNKFYVHGCFCSLECAAAYNFSSPGSVDEIWDRYSMINMLSAKINPGSAGKLVGQAPDRLALNMFGGHLGIEEFRNYHPTHKLTVVNFPPMMTLTRQIEEINDGDVASTHKYIPIDSERIDRYERKLNLKRTKPLVTVKNTLDRTMNIRYS